MRPMPAFARYPDWPERLAEFLSRRLGLGFEWGRQDCACFAADAVAALTGRDPMAALRGSYASEEAAELLLAARGGFIRAVQEALAAAGLPPCSVDHAQRGDLSLIEHGNMLLLGVVAGDAVAAPGAQGLVFVPPLAMRRAWAV